MESKEEILAKIAHRIEPKTSIDEFLEDINDEEHREEWVDVVFEAMETFSNHQNASLIEQNKRLMESLRLSNEWLKKIVPHMREHAGAVQYGITQNEQLLSQTEE